MKGRFRFWVQAGWPDNRTLPDMADGTTERVCYVAVVCSQKRKCPRKKLRPAAPDWSLPCPVPCVT